MHNDPIILSIFVIFTGSAILATLALYARQALIVGYIVWGIILGPSGFAAIENPVVINEIAHIGIIFLLFLLGLNLKPQDLIHTVRKTTLITVITSLVFMSLGFVICRLFNFAMWESLLIGSAMMFSSTIIGLKLLPTTVLHHRHAGEVMVSILLLQDLFAIIILLIVQGWNSGSSPLVSIGLSVIALPILIGFAILFERYILIKVISKFDKIQEYIFLVTIGWCLGMAKLAATMGLSYEIGAFIGGVVLASSPIALFIAESLKPLRDFFLIIFFFTLGAGLELGTVYTVLIPAIVLAGTMLLVKPLLFRFLMVKLKETTDLSLEMGVRLGQISEFSLLIAVVALESKVISHQASYLIQAATIITFVVSSYFIVLNYPTPIAVSDRLRRD
ncbi:cation:proton antiporter [Candidatus Halobeggiatoa sp. HSG11]|nr:cation:proton antiporter [Candidatus Halobeggiatoa sp. HSG11]